MSYPDCPIWGEEEVKNLIEETVPPGEEHRGFDDRMLFIETLTLAIAFKEDGKLLCEIDLTITITINYGNLIKKPTFL